MRIADETGFGWRVKKLAPKKPGGAGAVVGVAEISELVHALAMTDTDTSKDVRIIAWGGPADVGATVWDQRLGGAADEVATAMIDHPAGGMIVANTVTGATLQSQIWRVSDTGNPQWTWASKQAKDAIVSGLTVAAAGGVVGAGSTLADVDGVDRGWIVALTAAGKLLWQRGYGTATSQRFRAVAALPAGGLVAVGDTGSAADPRWWMARLAADGGLLVHKVASVRSRLSAIVAHHGGLLVAAGTSWPNATSTDGLLFGTDTFGNIVWDRSIDVGVHDTIRAVSVDVLGRIAASGHTSGKGLVIAADPWGNVKCAASGACANKLVTKCDDGAPCTKDVCTAANGCVSEPAVGTRCSDGDGCSTGGTCTTKGCAEDPNGRLHTRTADVGNLASIGASALAADDGLMTWARRTNGDVVVVRTDRLGAVMAEPVVAGMAASSVAGGRALGDGGSVVVYTTTDGKVIARRVDANGKAVWDKTLAAATVNVPCKCQSKYCENESPHVQFDSVRGMQVLNAAQSGHILALIEQGSARTCSGTTIGGNPSVYTRSSALIGCSVVIDVSVADGAVTQRSRICRGYQNVVSLLTADPYVEYASAQPVQPRAVVVGGDGIIVAGYRRLTKYSGPCNSAKAKCSSAPTGELAGWVIKTASASNWEWAWSGTSAPGVKSGRFEAVTATSNGGYMAVGTGLDSSDQSRLWLVQLGSGGSTLWQRFLAGDVGAYNVRQLMIAPGDDLLIAGSRTEGGIEKLWLNRRTREGLELWDRAYHFNGAAVLPATAPMLRSQDGRVFLAGTTTVNGSTKALFIRADPWGSPTCAASGACGQKPESECADGKADTWDTCQPTKTKDIAEGCQNKPLPCVPRKACETATTHAKLGCTYAADTCDDNNACAVDSCDPDAGTPTGGGCAHKALDPAVDCDDAKPCTLDKCDTKTGCIHPNAPEGLTCATSPCDDGTCKQGICDAKVVATRIGCGKDAAADSCLAILKQDPKRRSGTYWIDPDGGGSGDASYLARCDMELDGGGWTLLLKSNGDCTFHYGSKFWAGKDLLSPWDTTLKPNNAKYGAYNVLPLGELRWVWPTLDGMRGVQPLPTPNTTALALFTPTAQVQMQPPAGVHYSGWPATTAFSLYGFSMSICLKEARVKWGWSTYHQGCSLGLTTLGVGMTCHNGISAGWHYKTAYDAEANKNGAAQPVLVWGR